MIITGAAYFNLKLDQLMQLRVEAPILTQHFSSNVRFGIVFLQEVIVL